MIDKLLIDNKLKEKICFIDLPEFGTNNPFDNYKKGGSFVNNINSNINSDKKIDEYLVNINTNNSASLTNEIQKIKDNINTTLKNTSFRNFSVSATDDIRLKRKNSENSIENPFKSNDNKDKDNNKDKDKDKEKNTNPFSSNNLTTKVVKEETIEENINDSERKNRLKNALNEIERVCAERKLKNDLIELFNEVLENNMEFKDDIF